MTYGRCDNALNNGGFGVSRMETRRNIVEMLRFTKLHYSRKLAAKLGLYSVPISVPVEIVIDAVKPRRVVAIDLEKTGKLENLRQNCHFILLQCTFLNGDLEGKHFRWYYLEKDGCLVH